MNNHAPQEVPSVVAPPAVPPTAPEPPQISAPPAIDMSSPYSFVETPATKAAAEASSPYGMPTNLAAPTVRPRPYIAPPVTPTKPVNAWSVPASVSTETETPAAAGTPSESDSSANLEDQLGAIEMKLNGKKQKNMPILKRHREARNINLRKSQFGLAARTNRRSPQKLRTLARTATSSCLVPQRMPGVLSQRASRFFPS